MIPKKSMVTATRDCDGMDGVIHARRLLMLLMGAALASCHTPPVADTRPIPSEIRKQSMRWSSALIVSRNPEWKPRYNPIEDAIAIPDDAEGGSATPVSADGYFLTASHVVESNVGGVIYLWYGQQRSWRVARMVWRDERADLALLHVPMATAGYFQWTPSNAWLPGGTRLFHIGMATGPNGPMGKMLTDLRPESRWTSNRLFKMDILLKPGDSGGAILDRYGRLVGINSAVEFLVPMETAFFIDSEGSRPNVRALERIMHQDRVGMTNRSNSSAVR